LITLSRAARLVGVKRCALQKRIRQGELRTFEGELLLADLLQAYPQTEIEDTTMLERVEHIMESAVNKVIRPASEDPPDTDTLAARILTLGQELARARQQGRRYANLVNDMQQKMEELAAEAEQTQDRTFTKLKDWFMLALASTDTSPDDSEILAREAFLRVMAAQVRILPSGHDFFIEGSDSILEAGLRGGLALDYGCSNGNCGKCKAKVVSGQVKKICPHDYVLSETEKGLGYILTCANTAVTDVVLEAEEALGSRDIPQQEIDIRFKKTECPDDHVIILHAKTPRTSRLRFLAGQYLSLELEGLPAQYCSVASCPCDDMNLQFHIPATTDNPFSERLAGPMKANTVISIKGPKGAFTLNEDSPRSIVFIAINAGFGPIKSLIEHAMALDIAENLYLYWMTTPESSHYLGNLCRSWDDALDNFHYRSLEATDTRPVPEVLPNIIADLDAIEELDFYVCTPGPLLETVETLLTDNGASAARLRLEPVRQNQAE
ncbi:MAG: 2Fe-2S iron-sulfur cluster-binding protein, partial [Gammaproteobacteria bacterium]|nr:2Fe-2S iron-sulfur cluster-binding protein [Gammaproteobacteria bacterium]